MLVVREISTTIPPPADGSSPIPSSLDTPLALACCSDATTQVTPSSRSASPARTSTHLPGNFSRTVAAARPGDTTRKHLGIIRKLSTPLNRPLAQEALYAGLFRQAAGSVIRSTASVAEAASLQWSRATIPLPAFRVGTGERIGRMGRTARREQFGSACRCRDDHPLEPVVRRKPCP